MNTNASRILEAAHIPHELIGYDDTDGQIDAISVADKIRAPHEQVFKTLVARGEEHGVVVFCLPAPFELHMKKAAAVSGNKRVELVRAKDLRQLTGYVRGGCSPVGMKKQYPTWIDETALLFERVYVSAGTTGAQLLVGPRHLADLVGATFADVT